MAENGRDIEQDSGGALMQPKIRIALILARAANGVIGAKGGLPWHLSEDLQHFKRLTVGKPVVMGRKTFVSIGRALPRRLNIVVTRDPSWHAADPGVAVVHDLPSALALGYEDALRTGADEIMVIGGADIFHAVLPQATRIYLTEIHRAYEGDVAFDFAVEDWRETARESQEAPGGPAFSFVTLDRPTAASSAAPP